MTDDHAEGLAEVFMCLRTVLNYALPDEQREKLTQGLKMAADQPERNTFAKAVLLCMLGEGDLPGAPPKPTFKIIQGGAA